MLVNSIFELEVYKFSGCQNCLLSNCLADGLLVLFVWL